MDGVFWIFFFVNVDLWNLKGVMDMYEEKKKYTVWWYFEANSGNEKDVIMNDDVVGREIDRCIFFTYRLNR